MRIYNYLPETGEYIRTSEASLDPLETKKQGKAVYLLPANATFEVPAEVEKNKKAVFQDGTWQLVPDFRGMKYYLKTGEEIIITELGVTVPKDVLLEPPPLPEPTEAELNEEKIQDRIRELAIQSLKVSGELPKDYK